MAQNVIVEDIKRRILDSINKSKTVKSARNKILKIFNENFRKKKYLSKYDFSSDELLNIFSFIANINLLSFSHLENYNYKSNYDLRDEYNRKKIEQSWIPHISGKKCYICEGKSNIRHHIVPLSFGGHNSYKNIRVLCNNCHKKIHPWIKG